MRTDRVDFLDLTFDRLTFSQVKDRLRAATADTAYGSADGSPGPLESSTPSGCNASVSFADVVAGTTLTRQPREASRRMMLRFTPKS